MTPLGSGFLVLQVSTLAAICAYVGWPMLLANMAPVGWRPVPRPTVDPRRVALERERDHALRALRDLDVDFELGRVGLEEHALERAELVALAGRLVLVLKQRAVLERERDHALRALYELDLDPALARGRAAERAELVARSARITGELNAADAAAEMPH